MAHVPSEVLTPRLPEIAGTETLTMVMSRISMKDAVAIAAVRNKQLAASRGADIHMPLRRAARAQPWPDDLSEFRPRLRRTTASASALALSRSWV